MRPGEGKSCPRRDKYLHGGLRRNFYNDYVGIFVVVATMNFFTIPILRDVVHTGIRPGEGKSEDERAENGRKNETEQEGLVGLRIVIDAGDDIGNVRLPLGGGFRAQ